MQDCILYLEKANLMQKICKRGPQSSEIFGQKFRLPEDSPHGRFATEDSPQKIRHKEDLPHKG